MFASPGPVLVQLGPFSVRWYGLMTAIALVVALWLLDRQARVEGLPPDDVIGCAAWAAVTGYIGARLYEVVFSWDYYGRHWDKILAVWEGGLAIHGGLIVGGIVGAVVAARRGLPVLRTFDLVGPAGAMAQAIGRWGNFFNEEAFGGPTDLPWGLYISPARRPAEFRAWSASTPPSSTNRCGTSWSSPCSYGGSGLAGTTGRARCSSGSSACTRWGDCSSRACASTASGWARIEWPRSRASPVSCSPSPASSG